MLIRHSRTLLVRTARCTTLRVISTRLNTTRTWNATTIRGRCRGCRSKLHFAMRGGWRVGTTISVRPGTVLTSRVRKVWTRTLPHRHQLPRLSTPMLKKKHDPKNAKLSQRFTRTE